MSSMNVEMAKEIVSNTGVCGDSNHHKSEMEFIHGSSKYYKRGKLQHLQQKQSLFPPPVLKQLCDACAEKEIFKWGYEIGGVFRFSIPRSQWPWYFESKAQSLCDACPDVPACRAFHREFRRLSTVADESSIENAVANKS